MTKNEKITFCLNRLQEIIEFLFPNSGWNICYGRKFDYLDEWTRNYLQIIEGDEYFIIYKEDEPLYAVNVTADSEMTALSELVSKLADKL